MWLKGDLLDTTTSELYPVPYLITQFLDLNRANISILILPLAYGTQITRSRNNINLYIFGWNNVTLFDYKTSAG